MPKIIERILLIISDMLLINLAFLSWIGMRENFGYHLPVPFQEIVLFSGIIYLFWLLIFAFFGLYRSWYAQSRFDEFISVVKTVSVGVLLIFLVTIDLRRDVENPLPLSRMMILSYWILLIVFVGSGRMLLRTVQRKFLEKGIGLRNTVLVGTGKKAIELYQRIQEYPALGYRVLGLVTLDQPPPREAESPQIPILGTLQHLPRLIPERQIEEVVIALEDEERRQVIDVLGACNGQKVNLKIVPDLYDILLGQARTNQIYGFPLIEILPELMPPWERRMKRLLDLVVSIMVLVGFLPVWLLVALAIKLDSRGPVFYKQERVGRNGKIFKVIKFRSMVQNAEALTGPVWAGKDDPRITRVGRILRRTRIDEVPQFINVLKGEMSLVGPRPERPYFVEMLKKEFPYYTRRLRVRPGITGWAQIKHKYDESTDDVRKKLQYDLYYIENISLRMDFKIILSTIYTMLSGKGH